jgi:hypothetical protein
LATLTAIQVPAMVQGRSLSCPTPLADACARTKAQVAQLPGRLRAPPTDYCVTITPALEQLAADVDKQAQ